MIERMELTIVGAGAIGGIIGAHLWRAGHAVQLVDRDHAHVAAIQAGGLEVAGHAQLVARVPACEPEAVTGPIETLILAVKTLHTEEALRPLVSRLAPDGWVISMQNGLEEGKIAALVGEARTAAAFLSFGGYYDRPGRVVYSGPGTLKVGELDGRLTSRITALARVLSDFHPTERDGEHPRPPVGQAAPRHRVLRDRHGRRGRRRPPGGRGHPAHAVRPRRRGTGRRGCARRGRAARRRLRPTEPPRRRERVRRRRARRGTRIGRTGAALS